MYVIYDTYNGHPISRHKTLKKAYSEDKKFRDRVRKNSPGGIAYIPTQIYKEQRETLVSLSEEEKELLAEYKMFN